MFFRRDDSIVGTVTSVLEGKATSPLLSPRFTLEAERRSRSSSFSWRLTPAGTPFRSRFRKRPYDRSPQVYAYVWRAR